MTSALLLGLVLATNLVNVHAATVPGAPGTAPTVATATMTACGVKLSWAAPSSNGGTPILSYAVYASGGGTLDKKMAVVQGVATTSHFVTGLRVATAYTFMVAATNGIGEGSKSPVSATVTTQHFRESRPFAAKSRFYADSSSCLFPGKYFFVSDFANDRVLRFDHATKAFKDVFVQKGSGGLSRPWGIAFNKFDDEAQPRTFYVGSEGTESILQYDACDGSFIKKFANVPGEPRGMTFHTLPSRHKPPRQQKMLLVASHFTHQVLKFNALTGAPLGSFANGIQNPVDVVVGPDDDQTALGRSKHDVFVAHENGVTQLQHGTGAFKAKMLNKDVNTASGLAFAQVLIPSGLVLCRCYAT